MHVPRLQSALVATDLSTFANRAVPFAFALTDEGGEVHIAHVVDEDAELDEADVLKQLTSLAPAAMKRTVKAHILRGDDAARTIAQASARLGVDAICIASHGRSGITRALVGSVADKLLRETRKPVLVLRPA
jgi:nucleotide-binding universal stress UspA family protein